MDDFWRVVIEEEQALDWEADVTEGQGPMDLEMATSRRRTRNSGAWVESCISSRRTPLE